ncbi:MAG: hypothetical protein HC875_21100 [Anaerolineales bacterium]|nr:hypothetical protein [Anaerolineales bacterium]
MPTLNLVTELTVDDLLAVVAKLDDDELAEFEMLFEQLWLTRAGVLDREAAQIAAANRFSPRQQVRLRTLLEKNREEGLAANEINELDSYIAEIDEALETTADNLLKLAEQRRQAVATDAQ